MNGAGHNLPYLAQWLGLTVTVLGAGVGAAMPAGEVMVYRAKSRSHP